MQVVAGLGPDVQNAAMEVKAALSPMAWGRTYLDHRTLRELAAYGDDLGYVMTTVCTVLRPSIGLPLHEYVVRFHELLLNFKKDVVLNFVRHNMADTSIHEIITLGGDWVSLLWRLRIFSKGWLPSDITSGLSTMKDRFNYSYCDHLQESAASSGTVEELLRTFKTSVPRKPTATLSARAVEWLGAMH